LVLNKKSQIPPREELDQAFHYLHEQITRISVEEEVEMVRQEKEGLGEQFS
jgi:hypothetical protein